MAERGRGRGLVVLVVILVVVAGVLVGGDVLARSAVQSVAAERVRSRLTTVTEPTVEFRGFPFLTQVAAGRFQAVHVSTGRAEVTLDSKQIVLERIDATAYDVVATQRYQRIVAGRAEIAAVLPYASASTLLGLKLNGAGDGRIQADFELPIAGVTVSGIASGRPVLDPAAQQLTFTDVNVRVANADVGVADAVGRVVLAPIPLSQVPYGLRLTSIEARDDGIAVAATGENLPLQEP